MADFASSESDLLQNDGFYHSLFENLEYGCAYCRMIYKDGKPDNFVYLAVNAAFEVLTGLKDVVGKKVTEVIPNIRETDFQFIETYGRVAGGGKPERFEFFLEALKMWLLVSVYCPKQDHFVSVFDVITERKQTEMALQKVYSEMQRLLDVSAAGLARFNRDQRYLSANSAYAGITGIPLEHIIGNTIKEVIGVERHAAITPYIEKVLNGEQVEYEVDVPFKYSGAKYLHVVFTPDEDDLGTIVGWVSSVTDITELKQAEDVLRRNQSMLARTESITHTGSWEWEIATDTVTWSEELFRIVRRDPAEGAPSFAEHPKLYHPDDMKELKRVVGIALSEGTSYEIELRAICPDGEIRNCLATGFVHRNSEGRITHLFGTLQDITERKKAEEEKQAFEQQLLHTQKLESLGVLAGGIAHDFNNILAIIMGYCNLIKMDYESAEINIPEMEKAVERAAGLCRQMMSYAGKAEIIKAQVNMKTLVDETVAMLKATLPQNAEIKPDLSTHIFHVIGDVSQLRQIVMNLIINASEAIGKDRGVIHVSLANELVTASQPVTDYNGKAIPPGEYVCLEVTDNGCGMDEETKWRVFEPFYTTKFSGRGLGMSATLGIINSHNGALQLFTQVGQGTTFKIYLPVSPAAEDKQANSTEPVMPWQGSGTVLLVEDEDQVRDIAKTYLELCGFAVLEAVNGKEALELYKKNAEISLVLTDMGMPVMDGYELIGELKSLNSKLPIIISSGFGDTDVVSRVGSDNIAGIISKPYGLNQFIDVLTGVVKNA